MHSLLGVGGVMWCRGREGVGHITNGGFFDYLNWFLSTLVLIRWIL